MFPWLRLARAAMAMVDSVAMAMVDHVVDTYIFYFYFAEVSIGQDGPGTDCSTLYVRSESVEFGGLASGTARWVWSSVM